tara:strand:- start:39 stop:485 length:447 start_codon:yes stop_codon:yes gene_type:complete
MYLNKFDKLKEQSKILAFLLTTRIMANTVTNSWNPAGKLFFFRKQSKHDDETRTENFNLILSTDGDFRLKHGINTYDTFDGESNTSEETCYGNWTNEDGNVSLKGKMVKNHVSYKHTMDEDSINISKESDFFQVYSCEELAKMNYNEL